MLSTYLQLGIFFATMIFAAGGAWVALKEAQRHVNGLGAKMNAMEKERNDRHNQLCMAILALAPEEKKQLVVECLGGKQQ